MADRICTTVDREETISTLSQNSRHLYALFERVHVSPYLCICVYVCRWMDGWMIGR